MKIKKIEFKNFKCYPELIIPQKEDENLPDGLFLIQGNTPQKSNSFGKTSFVEGILFGFFGPQSISLSINNLITFGKKNAEIKIIFELDGKDYMVHRILNRTGKSGTQKQTTYVKSNSIFRPDNSINIEHLLEIQREQALKTVFVKQGEIDTLATASPATLRDLIIKLFRLDIINYAEKFLKSLRSNNDQRLKEIHKIFIPPEEIDYSIQKISMKLSKKRDDLKERKKALKNTDQELKVLPDKTFLTKIDSLNRVKEKIQGQIELFEENIMKKENDLKIEANIEKSKLMEIINKKKEVKKDVKKDIDIILKQLEEIKSTTAEKNGEIKQIQGNKSKMKINIQFEKGKKITNCPTCTREISFDEAKNIINSYDQEISKLNNDIKELMPKLKELENLESEKKELLQEINTFIKDLDTLKGFLLDKIDYDEKLTQNQIKLSGLMKKFGVSNENDLIKKFSVDSVANLRDKITQVENEITNLNNLIVDIKNDISELESEIQGIKEKKEKMVKLFEEMEELEKINLHISKNNELVKSFITEYMVEKRLITNIQYTTNKFLKNFTGNQYSNLNLYSVKEGSGIEIDVFDEFNQDTKEVKFLSGGDKVALGFALRMGISDLMTKIRPTKDSPKRNPKISFMILDEPLAALDESRRLQVLTTLESQVEFNQVFLITHTNIPEEINPHFIKISKNFKNGLSEAIFIPKENNMI